MRISNRYFGTPGQQALEARADLLWQLVRGDPRFATHGRAVALTAAGAGETGLQIALARLQGVGPSSGLSGDVLRARVAAFEEEGLVTDVYEHWRGDARAVDMARALIERRNLPEELTLCEVDAQTGGADFDSLDALTQSCGVLMPASAFLSGEAAAGVCLYARTAGGEAVGVAAAIAETPGADRAWWGMLSTAEAWRGRGIAKLLGAMVLDEMSRRHGIGHFHTGIRAGNVESAALSTGLGFAASGLFDLMAIDPAVMSGGRMTK